MQAPCQRAGLFSFVGSKIVFDSLRGPCIMKPMNTTKTATKKQISFTLRAIETLDSSGRNGGLKAHLKANAKTAALLSAPYLKCDPREFASYLVAVACGF